MMKLNHQATIDMDSTSAIPKYISHIKERETKEGYVFQSNDEHCMDVAKLAEQFASEFGMGNWGYILGLLHDKGKEKKEFQEYIQDVNGIPGHKHWTQMGKAHSYVGAILAKQLFPSVYPMLSYPIMGHHSELDDYYNFQKKMSGVIPDEVTHCNITTSLSIPGSLRGLSAFDYGTVIRMLFSCLKDADNLCTEKFMRPEKYILRGNKMSIPEMLDKLERHLQTLNEKSVVSDVNTIRKRVQDICRLESNGKKGFYGLTVPTGGGKTLSSILWALLHAKRNHQKRIIIAIPYTSIIVQTASILKEIFGEENVLEHHCNFNVEDATDDEEEREKIALATENWDYPIIVTTNVRLFESMFSNKRSDCRKLHNIANSVIILDEVQALPIGFLQPIISTLKLYKQVFGVSVLFTTASQPILCGQHVSWGLSKLNGIDEKDWHEIIPADEKLHDKLRRVEIHADKEVSTYDDIANRMAEHSRVLCIVNSRKDAQEIFKKLPKEGLRIHLSRLMYPEHVSSKIEEIKKALKSDCPIIRVVSTQLVEAGVDIDFPVVFRQEAGLDSILQAAGRCNREGKIEIGNTYVFKLHEQSSKGSLGKAIAAYHQFKIEWKHYDWLSPVAMNRYFRNLYATATFDKNKIEKDCKNSPNAGCLTFDFETIHKKFKMIADDGIGVVVLNSDNKDLIQEVKTIGVIDYRTIKHLGKYTVNIRERDFEQLKKDHSIEEIVKMSGIYCTQKENQYDPDIGLLFKNLYLEETYIIDNN